VWRGTPLEAVGDNHSPDPMDGRQWGHLHFKELGVPGMGKWFVQIQV